MDYYSCRFDFTTNIQFERGTFFGRSCQNFEEFWKIVVMDYFFILFQYYQIYFAFQEDFQVSFAFYEQILGDNINRTGWCPEGKDT